MMSNENSLRFNDSKLMANDNRMIALCGKFDKITDHFRRSDSYTFSKGNHCILKDDDNNIILPSVYTGSNCHNCAERNLINIFYKASIKHNVTSYKRTVWIYKRMKKITVLNSTGGPSIPCIYCKKELDKYNPIITYKNCEGNWISERSHDITESKMTSGQRKNIKNYKKNQKNKKI